MLTTNMFNKIYIPRSKSSKFLEIDNFEQFAEKEKCIKMIGSTKALEGYGITESDFYESNREKLIQKIHAIVMIKENAAKGHSKKNKKRENNPKHNQGGKSVAKGDVSSNNDKLDNKIENSNSKIKSSTAVKTINNYDMLNRNKIPNRKKIFNPSSKSIINFFEKHEKAGVNIAKLQGIFEKNKNNYISLNEELQHLKPKKEGLERDLVGLNKVSIKKYSTFALSENFNKNAPAENKANTNELLKTKNNNLLGIIRKNVSASGKEISRYKEKEISFNIPSEDKNICYLNTRVSTDPGNDMSNNVKHISKTDNFFFTETNSKHKSYKQIEINDSKTYQSLNDSVNWPETPRSEKKKTKTITKEKVNTVFKYKGNFNEKLNFGNNLNRTTKCIPSSTRHRNIKELEKLQDLNNLVNQISPPNSDKIQQNLETQGTFVRSAYLKGNQKSKFSLISLKRRKNSYEHVTSKIFNTEPKCYHSSNNINFSKERNNTNTLTNVIKYSKQTYDDAQSTLKIGLNKIKQSDKFFEEIKSEKQKTNINFQIDKNLRNESKILHNKTGVFFYGNGTGYHMVNRKAISGVANIKRVLNTKD